MVCVASLKSIMSLLVWGRSRRDGRCFILSYLMLSLFAVKNRVGPREAYAPRAGPASSQIGGIGDRIREVDS